MTKKFEVTIAFTNNDKPEYQNAVEIAKRNPLYEEIPVGRLVKHVAVYDRNNLKEFFNLYDAASDFITYVLINGKTRPFMRELWLPLLWFLK
jgi:hypothetical protein